MKIRLQQKGQIATKRDDVLLKQNRKSDCNKKYNCQSQDRREVIIQKRSAPVSGLTPTKRQGSLAARTPS